MYGFTVQGHVSRPRDNVIHEIIEFYGAVISITVTNKQFVVINAYTISISLNIEIIRSTVSNMNLKIAFLASTLDVRANRGPYYFIAFSIRQHARDSVGLHKLAF